MFTRIITISTLITSLAFPAIVSAAEISREEAVAFITSRVPSNVNIHYNESGNFTHIEHTHFFSVIELNFGTSPWRWVETGSSYATNNTQPDLGSFFKNDYRISYSVEPSDLVATVEVTPFSPFSGVNVPGVFSLRMSCAVQACISSQGSKFNRDDGVKETKIDQINMSNYWQFNKEDDARRVAKALEYLIKLSGGKPSPF